MADSIRTNFQDNFAARLGTGIGSGVAQGIQNLTQQKLNQIQQGSERQRYASALTSLQVPPEYANAISQLPVEQQKLVLQKLETILPQFQGQQQQGQQQSGMNALPGQQQSPDMQGMQGAQQFQGQPQQPGQGQQGVMLPGQKPSIKGLFTPSLSPDTQAKLAQAERHQNQNFDLKQQAAIEKSNAPFRTKVRTAAAPAREVFRVTNELKDLLKTGKVDLGTITSFEPGPLQNPETQAFVGKIKELVVLKSQLGEGVATKQRLAMEEAAKPALWNNPQTVEYLIDTLNNSVKEPIAYEDIVDKIVAENNGIEPKGLETKAKKEFVIDHKKSQLPPASNYSDDASGVFGGLKWKIVDNGGSKEWVYVGPATKGK